MRPALYIFCSRTILVLVKEKRYFLITLWINQKGLATLRAAAHTETEVARTQHDTQHQIMHCLHKLMVASTTITLSPIAATTVSHQRWQAHGPEKVERICRSGHFWPATVWTNFYLIFYICRIICEKEAESLSLTAVKTITSMILFNLKFDDLS
jgi:hypothetical protein